MNVDTGGRLPSRVAWALATASLLLATGLADAVDGGVVVAVPATLVLLALTALLYESVAA